MRWPVPQKLKLLICTRRVEPRAKCAGRDCVMPTAVPNAIWTCESLPESWRGGVPFFASWRVLVKRHRQEAKQLAGCNRYPPCRVGFPPGVAETFILEPRVQLFVKLLKKSIRATASEELPKAQTHALVQQCALASGVHTFAHANDEGWSACAQHISTAFSSAFSSAEENPCSLRCRC